MDDMFPRVDPIPLPAPVWLFKLLHIVTLGLHFVAMEMLVGGLLVVAAMNLLALRQPKHPLALSRAQTGQVLANRMPIVMTYVINLGVPPLLFTQVLYGRAIYTSSILIGLFWLAVIFLLAGCYWLLYRTSARASANQPYWHVALAAWVLAVVIARIYATNMTLMLRPEVWNGLYINSPLGVQLPMDDPTTTPRWLFILAGGFTTAGFWLLWLAPSNKLFLDVQTYMSGLGGKLASIALLAQGACAYWVVSAQPPAVQDALGQTLFTTLSGYVWVGCAALLFALALYSSLRRHPSRVIGWTGFAATCLAMLAMTAFRDGLRDITLLTKGFDVWDRVVVTNWSVVAIFLILFVLGLGIIGWLLTVVLKAKPVILGVDQSIFESQSRAEVHANE
jgi:uncharacterized membrane protein